jgi:FtsH-binding integral membrane protein
VVAWSGYGPLRGSALPGTCLGGAEVVRRMASHKPGLDWMISVIGVGVFAGLTAYDTQRIKAICDRSDDATSAGRKAVMGALSLYLNFINLFMMMLRLMGGRR